MKSEPSKLFFVPTREVPCRPATADDDGEQYGRRLDVLRAFFNDVGEYILLVAIARGLSFVSHIWRLAKREIKFI